jgi:hypothetical protein
MNLSRQSGILPARTMARLQLTIIGAGGIGSCVGLEASKMGMPKMTVYDADKVSSVNPSSQNYRPADVGKLKVNAFKEIVEMFSTTEVTAIPMMFTGETKPKGIVISAVDSMDARIDIWNKAIRYNLNVPLYIEARMGAEELRVYSLCPTEPEKVKMYEGYLYPSSKAHHAPCTEKAIAYTTFMAASIICRELKAFLTEEPYKFENILGLKSRMWVVQ